MRNQVCQYVTVRVDDMKVVSNSPTLGEPLVWDTGPRFLWMKRSKIVLLPQGGACKCLNRTHRPKAKHLWKLGPVVKMYNRGSFRMWHKDGFEPQIIFLEVSWTLICANSFRSPQKVNSLWPLEMVTNWGPNTLGIRSNLNQKLKAPAKLCKNSHD